MDKIQKKLNENKKKTMEVSKVEERQERKLKLGLLSVGASFGERELIKPSKRQWTVQCISGAGVVLV